MEFGMTSSARWWATIHRTPEPLADAMMLAAKMACTWFVNPNIKFAGEPSATSISDEEALRRVEAWHGGYIKEYKRTPRLERSYDIRALPFWLKRALAERWQWCFEHYLKDNPEVSYDPASGFTGTPS